MANCPEQGAKKIGLAGYLTFPPTAPDIMKIPIQEFVSCRRVLDDHFDWFVHQIYQFWRVISLVELHGRPNAQHIENQQGGHNPDEPRDVRAAASAFADLALMNLCGHDGMVTESAAKYKGNATADNANERR